MRCGDSEQPLIAARDVNFSACTGACDRTTQHHYHVEGLCSFVPPERVRVLFVWNDRRLQFAHYHKVSKQVVESVT